MNDKRLSDIRPNGNVSQGSASLAGPQLIPGSMEKEVLDISQFELTRKIGEASYQYVRLKDAESEKRLADAEYKKQSSLFDTNSKLREVVENRLKKAERALSNARTEYIRAAKEAEPILRLLYGGKEQVMPDETTIRNTIIAELKDFVTFQTFNNMSSNFERRLQEGLGKTIRGMINREMRDFTRKSDFDQLADEVRNIALRQARPASSTEIASLDSESHPDTHGNEPNEIRTQKSNNSKQQTKDVNPLKGKANIIPVNAMAQTLGQPESASGKRTDIEKVQLALEKAQDVMNDQYVTIRDLQFQINTTLEGVRILNEHIEEYDKRLENLQTATDKFFTEVQEENKRRITVIVESFDNMNNKITEVSAKLEHITSSSSGSALAPLNLASTRPTSPKSPFPPTFASFNQNALSSINHQLEAQAKLHNERLNSLANQVLNHQHLITRVINLPQQVQQYCDDVSSRLAAYQLDHGQLLQRIEQHDANLKNLHEAFATHLRNSDNNFKETAIHMQSVKLRFSEHRKQLDNLITAWRETMSITDNLSGKYESLKDFLGTRVFPTIARIQKSLPESVEGTPVAESSQSRNQDANAGVVAPNEDQGGLGAPVRQTPGVNLDVQTDGGEMTEIE